MVFYVEYDYIYYKFLCLKTKLAKILIFENLLNSYSFPKDFYFINYKYYVEYDYIQMIIVFNERVPYNIVFDFNIYFIFKSLCKSRLFYFKK